MPIPGFADGGCLPPGIHECTLAEVAERFGRFERSSVRQTLTEKLVVFAGEARASNVVVWLGIDGSYITAKHEPNDIDLVLVLSASHNYAADLQPHVYNVVSRRRVRKRYDFDIFAAPENSPALDEHLAFFQQTRDRKPKGLLKVVL